MRNLSGTRRTRVLTTLSIGPHPQVNEKFVRNALHKKKKSKASGTSSVVSEM